MLEIAFTFQNLTGQDVQLSTIIDGVIEPVIQTIKSGEEIVHFSAIHCQRNVTIKLLPALKEKE